VGLVDDTRIVAGELTPVTSTRVPGRGAGPAQVAPHGHLRRCCRCIVEEEFDPVRVADGIVVGDDGANVDRVARRASSRRDCRPRGEGEGGRTAEWVKSWLFGEV